MCETEITQLVTRIVAWLAEHGPDYVQRPPNPGATEAELTELAAYLGHPLPSALAAMLRVANGDFYIGEYVTLSTQAIARTWNIGRQLVADGTYARFEPHYESGGTVKPGWWHLGLIPVLEDSCGNQLCIDLGYDPGPNGAVDGANGMVGNSRRSYPPRRRFLAHLASHPLGTPFFGQVRRA